MVVEMVIDADGSLAGLGYLPGAGPQPCQAGLQRRGRLAGRDTGRCRRRSRPSRAGREPAPAGPDRAKPEGRSATSTGRSSLETIEAKPVFDGDQIPHLEVEEKNRAKEIIEDFMIAANGVTARYLSAKKFPSIRRVVRTPKTLGPHRRDRRGTRIRAAANPDSKALEEFLVKGRAADPLRFPDLSLAVIKLLGAGEYVAEAPRRERPRALWPGGQGLCPFHRPEPPLSRPDHPAPVESRLAANAAPYSNDELDVLAEHCTEARGCRQQGRTAGRQVRGGAAPRIEDRRAVRRARDGRVRQRHLGPAAHHAGGRETGAWFRGRRCRRPDSRATDIDQC